MRHWYTRRSTDGGQNMRRMIGTGLMVSLLGCLAGTAQATDCSAAALARQPVPLPATVSSPVSGELQVRHTQLGMPSGVLAATVSPEQSLALVLLRLRIEGCQDVAVALQATPAASISAAAAEAAAYKPQTAFDNTPWRFDMSQNGKRMTAEEFDAWMKSRGVRVVQARPSAATATVEQEPAN